jgi:hypothetical protein
MIDNGANNNKNRLAPTGYSIPSLKVGNKSYFNELDSLEALILGGYSSAQIKIAKRYSGFDW